jgi:WD40 repeat protein
VECRVGVEAAYIIWTCRFGDEADIQPGWLAAGFDRLAKVWDVKSGSELFSLYGNASNVFGVSFSPDGKYLATAGADGSIRTYALQMDELISLAKVRLTRTLTHEECQKFLQVAICP